MLSCAASLLAQTEVRPTFEAASVKPNSSGSGSSGTHGTPGQIRYDNITLQRLIEQAFGVMPPQVVGPDWLRDTCFDIVAKYPQSSTPADHSLMLRSLLEDRFKLTVHRDKREMNGYAMVVAKGGFKLKPVDTEDSNTSHNAEARVETVEAKGATMDRLANLLSKYLNAIVVDKTGVEGRYDFNLRWARENLTAPGGDRTGGDRGGDRAGGDRSGGDRDSAKSAPVPSLFEALQQVLGVRLQAQKVPAEVVVIDHAERVPTEN